MHRLVNEWLVLHALAITDLYFSDHLDAAWLDHVAVVSQAQLTPLIAAEGKQSSRPENNDDHFGKLKGGHSPGDHGGVFVPTCDDDDLVILDPELARGVLSELGLAESEDGARVGDLRVLHLRSSSCGPSHGHRGAAITMDV